MNAIYKTETKPATATIVEEDIYTAHETGRGRQAIAFAGFVEVRLQGSNMPHYYHPTTFLQLFEPLQGDRNSADFFDTVAASPANDQPTNPPA